jgi:hypothetical protein
MLIGEFLKAKAVKKAELKKNGYGDEEARFSPAVAGRPGRGWRVGATE